MTGLQIVRCSMSEGVLAFTRTKEASMAETANELQSINTAWHIAIQEILRMVIRDMHHGFLFGGAIFGFDQAVIADDAD
ncbi:hypothetical protein ACCS66_37765, partial [Rhizobium ruizarguesonis]